ncbi:MAG: prepilin-type N-terminal cleavage/methylation domain-containing protein [Thermoleophilia bacterium]
MARDRHAGGVTLVELLVALTVATITLAGAWSWLWTAAEASRAAHARGQAATVAAAAVRAVGADLQLATALLPPPGGVPAQRSLRLLHRHRGEADETVQIVWDPARGVLWRNAPGTYLADHVADFRVEYLDALGRALTAEELQGGGWTRRVARLRVTVEVTVGRASSSAAYDVVLMGAGA